MRSYFALDGAVHDVWLARAGDGYRLNRGVPHAEAGGAAGPRSTHHRPASFEAPLRGAPQDEEVEGGRWVSLDTARSARTTLLLDGHRIPVAVAQSGDEIHVHLDGRAYRLTHLDPVRHFAGAAASAGENDARAPMPGTVVALPVKPGDAVATGDPLIVIESMKLETTIRAPRAGTVESVHVAQGQTFDRDQVLVTLAEAA